MTSDPRYHFVSTFRLAGDPARLWGVLRDVEQWPRWWRGLERSELLRAPAGPAEPGAAYRQTVRAPFGYRLTYEIEITALDSARFVDAAASGDLVGRGRAALDRTSAEETVVWFAWLVETSTPWMRALAPLARPAFALNHRRVMGSFGTGLAEAAGMRLVSASHVAVAPGSPGFWILPEPPSAT